MQPSPFAARELAHRLVLLGRREEEALEQLGRTQGGAVDFDGARGLLDDVNHLALPAGRIDLIEHGVAVLVEVGQLHGGAEFDAPPLGEPPTGNQVQQCRLAGAIGPDDPDPILRAEVVAEVPQERCLAGALGLRAGPDQHVFGFDRALPQPPLVAGQAQVPLGLALGGLLHRLDPLDPRFLFGAARLRSALEPLQLAPQNTLEFRLSRGGRCFLLGLAGQVIGVVAAVVAGLAAIHLDDPVGHLIEDVAVVGDQHQGAAEALQIALEPLDAVGIEMVGGLVQQQDIRVSHQGGG